MQFESTRAQIPIPRVVANKQGIDVVNDAEQHLGRPGFSSIIDYRRESACSPWFVTAWLRERWHFG